MPGRESFLKSIRSAFVWKSLEKSTSFLKHLIVASMVGLSVQLDIFYMAIALIGVFVFSWARLVDVLAVPRLVKYHQDRNRSAFASLAGGLFNFSLLFSLLLTTLILTFSEPISRIAYGFEPARKALLSESFVWLAPAMIFYIPLFQLGSVCRALRCFSAFYRAEFLIGAIALVLIFLYPDHPQVLLWSFSTGVFGAFCLLCISARKFLNWRTHPFSADIRVILKSSPGLLSLQFFHYLLILSDRWFVSFLPKGNLGALAYGRMLSFLLVGLLNMQGAFLTVFSELDEALVKKNRVYNDFFSLSVFMALPASIFLILMGQDVVSILLERGVFSSDDTILVYRALAGFSWSLFPMIVLGPLEQIFQAQGKINLLVWRKVIGMLVNVLGNYFFLFVLGWGVFGIAAASSVSYWAVLLCGIAALRKIGLSLMCKRVLAWSLWMLSVSLLAAFLILQAGRHIDWPILIYLKPFIFAAIIIPAGFFYWGPEGALVKATLMRLRPGGKSLL